MSFATAPLAGASAALPRPLRSRWAAGTGGGGGVALSALSRRLADRRAGQGQG